MTKQETARVLAFIRAALPTQVGKLSSQQQLEMIDAYQLLLADIPYDRVAKAVTSCLQRESWIPSVADIRAAVGELAYLHGDRQQLPAHRLMLEAGIEPEGNITEDERAGLRDEYKRAMDSLFGRAAAEGSDNEH